MKNIQGLFVLAFVSFASSSCYPIDETHHDAGLSLSSDDKPDSGCRNVLEGICWDRPVPVQTGVLPICGKYSVAPETDVDDVGALAQWGFEVVPLTPNTECTTPVVKLSLDNYRFDRPEIINGAFSNVYGGGLHVMCPTDGYIISGSFVSSTEARGNFQYLPGCHRRGAGNYVATLIQ